MNREMLLKARMGVGVGGRGRSVFPPACCPTLLLPPALCHSPCCCHLPSVIHPATATCPLSLTLPLLLLPACRL